MLTSVDLQKRALDRAAQALLDAEKHYRTFLQSRDRPVENNPVIFEIFAQWLTVTGVRDELEKGELT